MKLNMISLFSGIGAFEIAAKRVFNEVHIKAAAEIDKYARLSYLANHKINEEEFHKDIYSFDATQYKGEIDIVVGGSPCQDFSIAGLRAGVLGQKGQLIWEYYRIIQETMPPYFIYENVKGMKSDRNGETLREFLEVFKELGYYCHWQVLNTKHYGIPQNRERIFIVGFLDKEIHDKFTFPEKIELKKAIKDLLEDNVPQKYYLSKRFIAGMEERNLLHKERGNGFNFNPKNPEEIQSVNCLTTKYGQRASDTFLKEPKLIQAGTLDIRGNDSIKRVYDINGNEISEEVALAAENGICPCLTTMVQSTTNEMQWGGGLREPKILESIIYDDYNSKIKEDGIAPCLTTNCGASAARTGQKVIKVMSENESIDIDSIIDYRIRKLTPKECLRFQDFPDSFEENCRKIGISDTQLYKQAGNSISANVLEMIFIQLKGAILVI